jgi:predicted TIM-barrel enzyme
MEIAPEILQVTSDLPVLAGVSAADPFRSLDLFLSQIHAMGFAGVQNSPTVGLYDGFFRRLLEDNGIGYDLEVKMVRIAHERDMLSCPCVFNIEEARMMALAGADMMIIHLGLPSRGSTKETDVFTLEGVTSFLDNISDSARRINPDLLCLGHAGPVREPADIEYVLKNSHHTHGFYHIFEPEPIAATMPALQLIERLKNIKINT